MAGFAVIYETGSSLQSRASDFRSLLNSTVRHKSLDQRAIEAAGCFCSAAKMDAPSSLHRGIVHDDASGSWLLAAGAILALEGDNHPQRSLSRFLADYLENGVDALEAYDGHFALVIFNGREKSLSIVSDPMGLFAIYYARRGKQVLVSTSALAVASQVCSKPDELTIECFLRTGTPYGEKTLWQDVKRVRPATVVKLTPDSFQQLEYWTLTADSDVARLPMDDALDIADAKVRRIFERFLSREGKVWADLTGGFDTRLTTLYLSNLGIPFTAYCVGPRDHPDVEVSKLVSQQMGWEYEHMPVPDDWGQERTAWFETALHKGDGLLSVPQLAATLMGQRERSLRHFVHVTGGGADEWRYHNYAPHIVYRSANRRVSLDDIVDARFCWPVPLSILRRDRTSEIRDAWKEHCSALVSAHSHLDTLAQSDVIFGRHRHPVHGGAYLSSEAGIGRPMIPFCAKDLQNFGFSLNHYWRLKYHFRFARNLIERGNPRLAGIRTAIGGPAMPIRLSNVYKFVPLFSYLADHFLQKAIHRSVRPFHIFPKRPTPAQPPPWKTAWLRWAVEEDLLVPEKMLSGQLYNPSELKTLVAQELAGKHQAGDFLDRVTTVEMAMRATGASLG